MSKVETSQISHQFSEWSKLLDAKNDRHDRLVKLSRDITSGSKKIIFGLHRSAPTEIQQQKLIQVAEENLVPIRRNILKLRDEMEGQHYWQHRYGFLWGIQEYCEAAAFLHFFKTGTMISKALLEEEIVSGAQAESTISQAPFVLSWEDYILGIADVTGELMRLAISSVGDRTTDRIANICIFISLVYHALTSLPSEKIQGKDWEQKIKIMKASLEKVEKLRFQLKLRTEEYGEDVEMRIDLDD